MRLLANAHGLHDKVTIVTGSNQGVGRATVDQLIRDGTRVVAVDQKPPIDADTESLTHLQLDIGQEHAAEEAVRSAIDRFGRLDAVVNNAAIQRAGSDAIDGSWPEWRRLLEVNLLGTIAFCVEAARAMSPAGAIVNVASVSGLMALPRQAVYAASKGAVIALTRSLAVDLAPNVRVNAVCPGPVLTPHLLEANTGDERAARIRAIADLHPLRRLASAEDISAGIVFLLSGAARHVTGTTLVIDGAFSAGLKST